MDDGIAARFAGTVLVYVMGFCATYNRERGRAGFATRRVESLPRSNTNTVKKGGINTTGQPVVSFLKPQQPAGPLSHIYTHIYIYICCCGMGI